MAMKIQYTSNMQDLYILLLITLCYKHEEKNH